MTKFWHQMTGKEALEQLQSRDTGLTGQEAEERLHQYGENALTESGRQSTVRIFLGQFKDLLVIILMIAALVSLLTGDGKSTAVIFAVLLLNACLGTVQQVRAGKSLDALKSLSSPQSKVMRSGSRIEVDSREIVPGDVLILEAGDMITADGRILENFSLQVNESSLTGESVNVDKQAEVLAGENALADRLNMVYSGSLVTYGRASVLVTETGMQTEIGRIAGLMNATKEKKSPLQISLDRFSARLAAGILMVSVLVFVLEMVQGMHLVDSLLFAVALAVAAIPEALGSIVTIVQAMGTQKMAREHAIIKDLAAVESLGSVSVICSDKTGTLTQNKMTVQHLYVGEKVITPEQIDIRSQLHRYLVYDAVLTNDSTLVEGKGSGDPTEYAFLDMYRHIEGTKHGEGDLHLSVEALRALLKRQEEVPFDSVRKLMSTKHKIHGVPTIFTKGAVDVLLSRCDYIRTDEQIRPMEQEDRENILRQNQRFSEEGLRVLAFAYKESDEPLTAEAENHYIFLGLAAQMDPPRPESVEAVREAKQAGIRTVMITGDHKVTATAIARAIGIFADGDLAVTGLELDEMDDAQLLKNIERITVYARVSPENKIRIVDAWQKKGHIVSMTGDGVNDAPALKKADIGVAMGITGTEVSKDAAAMILTDDNFATIIKAVEGGRTIYANIKNAVLFLLSGNLAAILCVLAASLLGLPMPFMAVQLLFINLVTDSLPALAIGMEPGDADVLRRPPREPRAGIMDKTFIKTMVLEGALIAAVVMRAYVLGLHSSAAAATSMAFLTLTLARLFHGFNCRGRGSLVKLGLRKNRYSLAAFAVGLLLVGAVVMSAAGRTLFSVVQLSNLQIRLIVVLALIPTLLIQAYRLFRECIGKQ